LRAWTACPAGPKDNRLPRRACPSPCLQRRRSPACRPHVSPGTEPDRHCRSCDPREPPGALLRRLWPLLSAPKLTQADTAQRSRRWIAHYSSQPSPLRSGPAEDGTRLLRDSSGVPRRSSASTAQGTSSGGGRTATKHQRTGRPGTGAGTHHHRAPARERFADNGDLAEPGEGLSMSEAAFRRAAR